jgi:hypothetical protein
MYERPYYIHNFRNYFVNINRKLMLNVLKHTKVFRFAKIKNNSIRAFASRNLSDC